MKKTAVIIGIVLSLLTSIEGAVAHCPLCTAGIGAAAVSARYFGLDASIIGVFVGAFGVSTGLWIGRKIKKKYMRFQLPLIVLSSFALTVLPLMGLIDEQLALRMLWVGSPDTVLNRVYFIDKMLFGSVLGAVVSLAAFWLHLYIKKAKGRVVVPFQGVIFTLLLLVLTGAALFFAVGD